MLQKTFCRSASLLCHSFCKCGWVAKVHSKPSMLVPLLFLCLVTNFGLVKSYLLSCDIMAVDLSCSRSKSLNCSAILGGSRVEPIFFAHMSNLIRSLRNSQIFRDQAIPFPELLSA